MRGKGTPNLLAPLTGHRMGMEQSLGRIIIITGLSGSGKSTALNALEDSGYFCIDNLPVLLLPKFLALRNESTPEFFKLGVVMDMREKDFVYHFKDVFTQIQCRNYDLQIVFLEASNESLVKRYSESRRRHPLIGEANLSDSIHRERELMAPVREVAHVILDTSTYNVHKLREIFNQRFAYAGAGQSMSIEILSFGFKYGLPPEADILMDVRFLPNPFYVDELRELDGRHERIVDFVLSSVESVRFIGEFCNLLEFVLPLYKREGKSYLTIAVGCTGGMHRSVTVVGELAKRLDSKFPFISVRHRDIIHKRESS